MKARVKETDEILKVVDVSLGGDCVWCQKGDDIIQYQAKDVELIREKNIDWENRRFELVKAAMQGTSLYSKIKIYQKETISKFVIELADAVLAEYRKGENK